MQREMIPVAKRDFWKADKVPRCLEAVIPCITEGDGARGLPALQSSQPSRTDGGSKAWSVPRSGRRRHRGLCENVPLFLGLPWQVPRKRGGWKPHTRALTVPRPEVHCSCHRAEIKDCAPFESSRGQSVLVSSDFWGFGVLLVCGHITPLSAFVVSGLVHHCLMSLCLPFIRTLGVTSGLPLD